MKINVQFNKNSDQYDFKKLPLNVDSSVSVQIPYLFDSI